MFRLYPATRDDVDTLVSIRRKSWLAHWAPLIGYEKLVHRLDENMFAQTIAKHWHKTLVARFADENSNSITGFATIIKNRIDGPWLDPAFKGYGAGTGLTALAESIIAKQNISPNAHKTKAVVEFLSADIATESFFRNRGYKVEKRYNKDTDFGPLRFVRMIRFVKFDESETPNSRNLAQTARYKSGIVKNTPKPAHKL